MRRPGLEERTWILSNCRVGDDESLRAARKTKDDDISNAPEDIARSPDVSADIHPIHRPA